MKVILNNGTELTPIIVTGEKRNVQGARRDCLTHVFAEAGLDEIDGLFTEANCENITIIGDDGSEAIYKGYTIRTDLTKTMVETVPATATTEAQYESRVTVTMAERTYAETVLAQLAQESTDTQIAVAELAALVTEGE